jgi:HK97 gp10 family phage protein
VPAAQAKAPRSLVHRRAGSARRCTWRDGSSRSRWTKNGRGRRHGGRRAETAVLYWKYLEYGTVKLAARPFFRPAALEKADEVSKIVQESLKDELGL